MADSNECHSSNHNFRPTLVTGTISDVAGDGLYYGQTDHRINALLVANMMLVEDSPPNITNLTSTICPEIYLKP